MRKRLTYANVVATLALVFAMSGGALAASHYLVNSTRQINPKVLKKLRGQTGPRGATGGPGAPGAPGKEGAAGKEGKEGKEGREGKEGVVPQTLPAGTSESGDWAVAAGSSTSGYMTTGVSFPVTLPAAPSQKDVEYLSTGVTDVDCPGPGKAASGHVCVYENAGESVLGPAVDESHGSEGADTTGFVIFVGVENAGAFAYGSWTATA